jgi:magnesium transporter
MMREVKTKFVTWINITRPDNDDIRYLQENFDIHPLTIEEFVTPTFRPKTTSYGNCLFLTIHIPLYDQEARTTYPGEVDIVLTKTHLITGHNTEIYHLEQLFESVNENIGKRRLLMSDTPAHLLYTVLQTLLESCFPRLDNIERKIDAIEDHIFKGNEKAMVREISFVKRDILNFRRTLKPQRSILESLAVKETTFIPKELIPYFNDLVSTNIRIWSTLESSKETIESLEDTNESLLSFKINEKVRVITFFSAILLPITIYANIFGMNMDNASIINNPHNFIFHISVMLALSLITFLFFKLRKWI